MDPSRWPVVIWFKNCRALVAHTVGLSVLGLENLRIRLYKIRGNAIDLRVLLFVCELKLGTLKVDKYFVS